MLISGLFALEASAGEVPHAVTDQDYRVYPSEQVNLGRLLFYDRVLSGTYRVSCATCHNPDRASSNGFRLDGKLDQLGDTLAINGLPLYDALKPSADHAPGLFNLGAREFTTLFSDGRVANDGRGGFKTPAGDELPQGLQDVLAAQSLFPAVNEDEFVGKVDNEISAIAHLGKPAVWNAVAERVQAVDGYLPLFHAAYSDVQTVDDISMVHIANAIGAFVGTEWRSDGSAFDGYLRGDKLALDASEKRGMELFYGKAGCDQCHSGTFQTDHGFHSVGMPLWRFDFETGDLEAAKPREGRGVLTGEAELQFAYRTPSLRNVNKTAPFGHAGSYQKLEDFLRDHINPSGAAARFIEARRKGDTPASPTVQQTVELLERRSDMKPVLLDEPEIADLIAFLASLTDPASLSGRQGRPEEVPSGLALD